MVQASLKIPGLERRRRSIGLLHIVAGFFLIANAQNVFRALALRSYIPLVPLFAVALASLAYGFLRGRLDPASRYNTWLRVLQAATFLSLAISLYGAGNGGKSLGLFLWTFIAGMLAFLERMALQQQVLSIGDAGVSFPNGYMRKELPWTSLTGITVRPDFLTLYYPDNKFLQFELAEPLTEPETEQVHQYSRKYLASGAITGQA